MWLLLPQQWDPQLTFLHCAPIHSEHHDYFGLVQRRQWHPTPALLPGKSHGRRSLVGCSPWGRWELDTTDRLHFHISLSCIGEGNGNPLQCSCLENPRDGGAWWAAVYGVAQSQTRLKWLSSSSSSSRLGVIEWWLYSSNALIKPITLTMESSLSSLNLCFFIWIVIDYHLLISPLDY